MHVETIEVQLRVNLPKLRPSCMKHENKPSEIFGGYTVIESGDPPESFATKKNPRSNYVFTPGIMKNCTERG